MDVILENYILSILFPELLHCSRHLQGHHGISRGHVLLRRLTPPMRAASPKEAGTSALNQRCQAPNRANIRPWSWRSFLFATSNSWNASYIPQSLGKHTSLITSGLSASLPTKSCELRHFLEASSKTHNSGPRYCITMDGLMRTGLPGLQGSPWNWARW